MVSNANANSNDHQPSKLVFYLADQLAAAPSMLGPKQESLNTSTNSVFMFPCCPSFCSYLPISMHRARHNKPDKKQTWFISAVFWKDKLSRVQRECPMFGSPNTSLQLCCSLYHRT
jgi:hypothetical protein